MFKNLFLCILITASIIFIILTINNFFVTQQLHKDPASKKIQARHSNLNKLINFISLMVVFVIMIALAFALAGLQ